MTTQAYGAYAADKPLEPIDIERREPGPRDVQIEIAYCGVCHSDLHTVRSEWGGTLYPCVPGHEIVGHVTRRRRARLRGFKVGDTVGVGCMVDSCQHCAVLRGGPRAILRERLRRHLQRPDPGPAGPYAGRLFAAHRRRREVRAEDPPSAKSSSPRSRRCCAPGSPPGRRCATGRPGRARRSGSSASGDWATWAIKLAHALGAHTVAFTTSESKRQDALDLGADEVDRLAQRGGDGGACRQLRLHPQHGRGEPRPRRLHRPAEARRHVVPGRSAGA